ncbi:MAG: PAS domain S-box-containing protein [Hyphomicrobiaceae bacterium]|jgi:PAS domain S-box-containing protein
MSSQSDDVERIQNLQTQNDERLRDFAEAASDWFFEMDAELRFTYVSERHREVIGVAPEQVIGKTRWDAHKDRRLPEENDRWSQHIATMQAHRSWKDFTYTLIRNDGERRVISNSAKAIFDKDGAFVGYRGVGRDVTDKAKSEIQLQSIMNVVPDAIIAIDGQGRMASFSAAAEKLFGYKATEVIGKNVKMLMPPPYHDEHDGYLAHYRTTGEKKIIGIGRQVEARRKDGSTFPMNLAVNEMTVEGRRMFTGVVQDISELKQAQSTSARLGQILDQSLNEIYVFDAETLHFVQVNHGARRNMGYSSAEMRQLTPVDIKPDYNSQKQFEAVIKPLRDGTKDLLVFETRHQRKDGSIYPVEVHLQLMARETPPVFVAMIQDVSEAQLREAILRQSQKMEAIGQLTGGIAHDFNNLLTIILGNNELLQGSLADDPRQHKLLNAATSAAERGAQLTGQLLSFARQQPLAPEVIDINALVEDMIDMLERTLGEAIELKAVLASDLGITLADPDQVHNALLNLAINARDAMPDGGKLIIETSNVDLDADAARMRPDTAPGRYVRLSVRDTGTGMPPEVQARVFDPFFTTKEKGKGTGLGLSMVHGFAKQSGGHIDLYSEFGYGTAISLYLPDANEDYSAKPESEAPSSSNGAGGETVLVVEDDASVREITVARLEHLGYKVTEAESGQKALDIFAAGTGVDVMLTDMVMPGGMTGAELCDAVRVKYPDLKLAMASGYSEEGLNPPDDTPWLRKPYSLAELAGTLRKLLD